MPPRSDPVVEPKIYPVGLKVLLGCRQGMSALPLNPAPFHLEQQNHLWVMHCSEGPVPRAGMRVARAFMQKELQPWAVRWEEDFQGIPAALRAGS